MEPHAARGLAQVILKDLEADVHSGATAITRKAAQCLTAFSEEGHTSAASYWKDLVALSRSIAAAQPSIASVFNLVNQVLLAVEPVKGSSSVAALQTAARKLPLRPSVYPMRLWRPSPNTARD
jgi:translation initiation factor 2B subunit (eIF-2B alpha/beta/delta family)